MTLVLDRCERPAAAMAALSPVTSSSVPGGKGSTAMAALPPAENFPDPGRKVKAKAALPRDTLSETDLATKTALSAAMMFSDLEGM